MHSQLLDLKITAIQIGRPPPPRKEYLRESVLVFGIDSRKFAMNLTVPFFTPEEYFLGDKPADYILGAFNPLDYIPTSTITRSDTTISPDLSDTFTSIETVPVPVPVVPLIQPPKEPDIVLFVGSPASGKSSFFREYLAPMGYERINQDTLKTRDRCVMEATALLEKNIPIAIGNFFLVPIHTPPHLLTFYPYSLLLLSLPSRPWSFLD